MNYIELINRFWQEVEMKDFLPSEACVYFRLLDICNKLGWQNPFSLSNSRAVALMAMNEKTFRAIRDKLGGRGLIEFKKGKKRESAPMYCFPEKTENGWVFPWGNFLEVKNTAKTTANTPVNDTVNTTANTPVNLTEMARRQSKRKSHCLRRKRNERPGKSLRHQKTHHHRRRHSKRFCNISSAEMPTRGWRIGKSPPDDSTTISMQLTGETSTTAGSSIGTVGPTLGFLMMRNDKKKG